MERLDLLPMAVLLMIGGKLPAQRAKSAHFVGHLPTTPGKFTEGWTDFALKGGNVIWIMGIDASLPGNSAPHQVYFS